MYSQGHNNAIDQAAARTEMWNDFMQLMNTKIDAIMKNVMENKDGHPSTSDVYKIVQLTIPDVVRHFSQIVAGPEMVAAAKTFDPSGLPMQLNVFYTAQGSSRESFEIDGDAMDASTRLAKDAMTKEQRAWIRNMYKKSNQHPEMVALRESMEQYRAATGFVRVSDYSRMVKLFSQNCISAAEETNGPGKVRRVTLKKKKKAKVLQKKKMKGPRYRPPKKEKCQGT